MTNSFESGSERGKARGPASVARAWVVSEVSAAAWGRKPEGPVGRFQLIERQHEALNLFDSSTGELWEISGYGWQQVAGRPMPAKPEPTAKPDPTGKLRPKPEQDYNTVPREVEINEQNP